jgi:hypothetical protein
MRERRTPSALLWIGEPAALAIGWLRSARKDGCAELGSPSEQGCKFFRGAFASFSGAKQLIFHEVA